ncbi:MAG: amidohydrolase [Clostridiales bacterium]|nr:amidohydrolase [Clostridiales bacterium]
MKLKLIINADILTMDSSDTEFKNGYIVIQNKKIAKVGQMSEYDPSEYTDCGAEIIDAGQRLVTPGLIDAHSHLGMWEDGLNFEGDDGNEDTDPCTPHLRAIDAVNPMENAFSEAFAAGITTVITGPGSANPIGGQPAAIKTYGRRIDDMIIKAPVGIKIALGENPKSTYNDKSQTPITRMATASIIRESLQKACDYLKNLEEYEKNPDEDEKPEYDIKSEALIPVLKGEIPLHAHAHRADDIFTAIRIAEEFGVKLVLVHCTEGHMIAEELKAEGYPVLLGPILTDRSKPELKNQSEATPAVLSAQGLSTAIITDHPETPEKYLPLCAAMAVKHGMDRSEALRAITVNPAKICGIDSRVGSIEAGKDADLVIWDGNPLDIMTKPYKVIV